MIVDQLAGVPVDISAQLILQTVCLSRSTTFCCMIAHWFPSCLALTLVATTEMSWFCSGSLLALAESWLEWCG